MKVNLINGTTSDLSIAIKPTIKEGIPQKGDFLLPAGKEASLATGSVGTINLFIFRVKDGNPVSVWSGVVPTHTTLRLVAAGSGLQVMHNGVALPEGIMKATTDPLTAGLTIVPRSAREWPVSTGWIVAIVVLICVAVALYYVRRSRT